MLQKAQAERMRLLRFPRRLLRHCSATIVSRMLLLACAFPPLPASIEAFPRRMLRLHEHVPLGHLHQEPGGEEPGSQGSMDNGQRQVTHGTGIVSLCVRITDATALHLNCYRAFRVGFLDVR